MDATILTATISAVAAIMVAIVTGLFTWKTGRKKGRLDSRDVVYEGFKMLVNRLQQERGDDRNQRQVLLSEISLMERERREMRARIAQLEAELIRHGIRIPVPESSGEQPYLFPNAN